MRPAFGLKGLEEKFKHLYFFTLLPMTFSCNQWSFNLCRCTELERDHLCRSRLTGRNSNYTYPQNLPGVTLRHLGIEVVFGFLDTFSPPPDPACADALLHITCYAATPPCNPSTNEVLPFCSDSCRAYKQLLSDGSCDDLYALVRHLTEISPSSDLQELVDLFFALDCNNTSTYIFGSYLDCVSQTKCTRVISESIQGERFCMHKVEQHRCNNRIAGEAIAPPKLSNCHMQKKNMSADSNFYNFCHCAGACGGLDQLE